MFLKLNRYRQGRQKTGFVRMILIVWSTLLLSYFLLSPAVTSAQSCIIKDGCKDSLYKCVKGQCQCRWGYLYQHWGVGGAPTKDVCKIIRRFFPQGESKAGIVAAWGPFVQFLAVLITGAIVVIGLIMIVFGGYLYMTAGGSASRVQQAKAWIFSALIGIIIALAALTILATINISLI